MYVSSYLWFGIHIRLFTTRLTLSHLIVLESLDHYPMILSQVKNQPPIIADVHMYIPK